MNSEKPEVQPKEQFRVVISREANEAIEAFIEKLASGSDSSKITKSDLANYIFTSVGIILNESHISEIRARYFDAKKALEGILKGATSCDDIPHNLREAVLKHCGIKPGAKEKRIKKLSTPKLVDNLKAG